MAISCLRIAVLMLILLPASERAMHGAEALKVGDLAPDFTLPMATKDTLLPAGLHFNDIVGKNIVILAFYPADWSGGCTKEMCALRDNFAEFSQLGASVYGISGDYIYSHREWARYHNLQFPLLSDHDHAVAKAYQSYNSETGYNFRAVFVIDRNGRIGYLDRLYKAGSADSLEKLRSAVKSVQ